MIPQTCLAEGIPMILQKAIGLAPAFFPVAGLVSRRGLPWSPAVVSRCGLLLWSPAVVSRCGLPLWSPPVVSRCGLLLWSPAVVSRCGLPQWSSAVVSCRGLLLWSPAVVSPPVVSTFLLSLATGFHMFQVVVLQ